MRVARLLVLLLFFYVIVVPLHARGDDVSGVVRGYVHDADNRPLRGARVFLESSQSPTSIRATDKTGRFTFLAVLPGDYIVSVSKDGYYSRCIAFLYIFPGQTKFVTFPLVTHVFNIGHCYYFDRD